MYIGKRKRLYTLGLAVLLAMLTSCYAMIAYPVHLLFTRHAQPATYSITKDGAVDEVFIMEIARKYYKREAHRFDLDSSNLDEIDVGYNEWYGQWYAYVFDPSGKYFFTMDFHIESNRIRAEGTWNLAE